MLGGPHVGFTSREIAPTLQGRIDKDTTIIIAAHGDLNKLYGHHELYAHISNEDYSPSTKGLLYDLDKVTTDPLHVVLVSCYGGAALGDVKALKKGSTLRTFSDAKTEESLLRLMLNGI